MNGNEVFSELYKNVVVSKHAIVRFNEATGIALSGQYLQHLALKAQSVEIREIERNGFRTDIYRRMERGILTWYTMNEVKKVPLVYVFQEIENETLLLVTVIYKRKEEKVNNQKKCVSL